MRAMIIRVLGVLTGLSTGIALVLAFGATAAASTESATAGSRQIGFVKVGEDRELYVDYQKPVPGKPVIVLLNGLTYRVGIWDRFTKALEGDGLGILRYDMMGMGETLLRYAPASKPYPFEDQIEDLKNLLKVLKIKQPVHIVGLSYGGAIGMQFLADYPDQVASLVLMAPFTAPLAQQDAWIRLQVQQTRLMNPSNPASFDELYDYFLRIIIYSTYPLAEPIVLENPYKLEATYRLVQGIRKFEAKKIVDQFPEGKIHLVIARQDQYVANEVHDELWEQFPAGVGASRLYIEGSEHKIPEAVPAFSAAWVKRIVDSDPLIRDGRTFVGTPWKHAAESGPVRVENLGD